MKYTFFSLAVFFVLNGCSKNNETQPAKPERSNFQKILKVEGLLISSIDLGYIGFNNDSMLFYYNQNNRIERVRYYSYHANAVKFQFDVLYQYDALGNIKKITNNAPGYEVPEKEVRFEYTGFKGRLSKAVLVYRDNGTVHENDSMVYSYIVLLAPEYDPRTFNGEPVLGMVGVSKKSYSRAWQIDDYTQPFISQYYLNKWSLPFNLYSPRDIGAGITKDYVFNDSNIVSYKERTIHNGLTNKSMDFTRTGIPNPFSIIKKNVYREYCWLTGLGFFSSFNMLEPSNFISRATYTGSPNYIQFNYALDSTKNTITQTGFDQSGLVAWPRTIFYFE